MFDGPIGDGLSKREESAFLLLIASLSALMAIACALLGWSTVIKASALGWWSLALGIGYGAASTFLAYASVRALGAFRTRGDLSLDRGMVYLPRYHWWSPGRCFEEPSNVVAVVAAGTTPDPAKIAALAGAAGKELGIRERRRLERFAGLELLVVTRSRVLVIGRGQENAVAVLRKVIGPERWIVSGA